MRKAFIAMVMLGLGLALAWPHGPTFLASVLNWSIGSVWAKDVGGFVVATSPAAARQSCVEPTETMRRNHMKLIRHQRDTTVYGGIRGTHHSLSGCVDCHVGYGKGGTPIAIDAHGQFCNACHEYAAVTLNCFECHATIPAGESWNQQLPAAWLHASP